MSWHLTNVFILRADTCHYWRHWDPSFPKCTWYYSIHIPEGHTYNCHAYLTQCPAMTHLSCVSDAVSCHDSLVMRIWCSVLQRLTCHAYLTQCPAMTHLSCLSDAVSCHDSLVMLIWRRVLPRLTCHVYLTQCPATTHLSCVSDAVSCLRVNSSLSCARLKCRLTSSSQSTTHELSAFLCACRCRIFSSMLPVYIKKGQFTSSGPISGNIPTSPSDFDEILPVASTTFQTRFCKVSASDNQWLVHKHH